MNLSATRHGQIQRGGWHGSEERDIVIFGCNRQLVCSNLVGSVSIRSHSIRTHHNYIDTFRGH